MILQLPEVQILRNLPPDGRLLFLTRILRLFAYGLVSVILVLYLTEAGLDERGAGLLISLTLAGDALISLWMSTRADRIGRRRMLMLGAVLMIIAGAALAFSTSLIVIALAVIIGTISPSGSEVGAFLSIEQAGLTQTTTDSQRTGLFAWYNLAGSLATACGALVGGWTANLLQVRGVPPLASYRAILLLYILLGGLLLLIFSRVSAAVEAPINNSSPAAPDRLGLYRSRGIVLRLSGLFMLDAFAGGLVVQSLMAYWFHLRFGVDTATLGTIFFGANIFAGLSALAAARVAAKIGLINTMVFTHLPSNILLMLVPLMPTLLSAIIVLLIRYSISQMDVPTRQSYVMAVVAPDERSAASGVTSIARSIGASLSPFLTGILLSAALFSWPFYIAGGLKIVYDLSLYRSFKAIKPPEEQPTT